MGGQLAVIDFLLTSKFHLPGEYDPRGQQNLKALAILVGFPGHDIISEKLICPHLTLEKRHQFGNDILKRLLSVGKQNPINPNISYPWSIYDNIRLECAEESVSSLTLASSQFYATLVRHGYKTKPKLISFDPSVELEHTFIFEGINPKTGKSWFLLEDGRDDARPFMFSVRPDKRTLSPLNIRISISEYPSELERAQRVSYGYYAIPPSSIQRIQVTKKEPEPQRIGIDRAQVIIHICIADPMQNARLLREFSEHIVFNEAIRVKSLVIANTNLTPERVQQLCMSYLFSAFKRDEVQCSAVESISICPPDESSQIEDAATLRQWKEWQRSYNEKYPGRAAGGYGPGALIISNEHD